MKRIGLIQLCSKASIDANLKVIQPFILKAAEEGISLVVLPENFAFMGKQDNDKFSIAESYGQGLIQDTIKTWAKEYGLWMVAGTLFLKSPSGKVTASSLVYDDRGDTVKRYDKIHLFDVKVSEGESHQESATIERGSTIEVVQTPVGMLGLSVCYDLRFPELYRSMTMMGAELFTVPSAFTAVTGKAHWASLLRARAIENLAYVLAPNQEGVHENGRETYGHSMVVDPWGQVLAEKPSGSGLIMADIDLVKLRQLRAEFPCNDHHILDTLKR